MEILNYLSDIYKYFSVFVLINTRIMAFFTSLIVFKREMITLRVLVALSTILSLYVFTLIDHNLLQVDMFSILMVKTMFMEFIVGFSAGLILNFIFEAFIVSGQFISTQIGLSIASLIDNRLGFITPLTEFYFIVATLLFFLLNGHLFVIKMLISSYQAYPLFSSQHTDHIFNIVFTFSRTMFSEAIALSITLTAIILLCNLTLAILSKLAPQFNLFSIGINIELLLGLFVIYLTFTLFASHSQNAISNYLNQAGSLFLGIANGR